MVSAADRPKIVGTPPDPLIVHAGDIVEYHGPLWRIYRSASKRRVTWDQLRTFGPVKGMRFDPHPVPPGVHPDHGVMYTAGDFLTTFAEVFYETRVIDRHDESPVLVSWKPTRPLLLLDLTQRWSVRNSAATSLQMIDDKNITQVWAREIQRQLGSQIDGLVHTSSVGGGCNYTLFERSKRIPSFPSRPLFSVGLADAAAELIIEDARFELNFEVI